MRNESTYRCHVCDRYWQSSPRLAWDWNGADYGVCPEDAPIPSTAHVYPELVGLPKRLITFEDTWWLYDFPQDRYSFGDSFTGWIQTVLRTRKGRLYD